MQILILGSKTNKAKDETHYQDTITQVEITYPFTNDELE